MGYSLDVHQIIDVITGSLHQFINYSAVSYMLIEPEKVLFKVHLENLFTVALWMKLEIEC